MYLGMSLTDVTRNFDIRTTVVNVYVELYSPCNASPGTHTPKIMTRLAWYTSAHVSQFIRDYFAGTSVDGVPATDRGACGYGVNWCVGRHARSPGNLQPEIHLEQTLNALHETRHD